MAMPLLISSGSRNQKQLNFAVSSNNYRNSGLPPFPSSINGGAESDFNGGDHQQVINAVYLNHSNFTNRSLSVVPSFNGGDQQVINGVSHLNHSNLTNTNLSVEPSFNGGDHQQVINGFSLNHSKLTNTDISVMPSFNGDDQQQVINGVYLNHSSGMYNRDLTLVPSFNGHEQVMNNEIISSHYSSYNQQELGFSVSSSNNLSLVPGFNGYEPTMMSTGVSSSVSYQQNLGFSVSSGNYINRSSVSLFPSFNDHGPFMKNGSYSEPSSRDYQNRSLSLESGFDVIESRRISIVRDYRYSSARLLAMRKIIRARLISAVFARRRMVINQEEDMNIRSGSSFRSQTNIIKSQQRRTGPTITELDEEACSDGNQTRSNNGGTLAPAPAPVSVHHPSRTDDENDDDDNGNDGITHSLPYRKYGPYTCPKCQGKFPTSQTFAAHVSSHYKYETIAQRRRRLLAKIRKRNLRLHNSGEGITLLPTEPVAQPEPVNMAGAETRGDDGALSIVQIKEESAEF